ncbi:MAG: lactate utilization protein [Rhodospirillales bacterium]|nr:lactate utilization protein [Rhodospirillales bacterium]
MSARDAILGRIRHGIARSEGTETQARATVTARLKGRSRHLQPARIDLDRAALIDLFVEKAQQVDATVSFVAIAEDVPEAVADYLRGRNLPAEAAIAPHPDLDAMDWAAGTMTVHKRAPRDADRIGINRAFGAVAETGTLVMASGGDSPATMNFLPEIHIAIVRESEITGSCEDVWDRIRARGPVPRTVNMVTGISRTGDIELTVQTGVHGPRYLHIVVVRDD